MPANGRACSKCDYYNHPKPNEQFGECRREILPAMSYGMISPDFWCGQYKPNQERKLAKNESKGAYGLFLNVKLTDDEHAKLIDRFGSTDTVYRINRLSRYISSKGDKYRSHYATILEWAERDIPTQQQGPIY